MIKPNASNVYVLIFDFRVVLTRESESLLGLVCPGQVKDEQ